MPKSPAETSEIAAMNATVRPSMRASTSSAISGGKNDGSSPAVHNAKRIPSAPPRHAMTTLSVSSCLTRRPRLAPSASRTAISRTRAVARESSSPATFAHAIASTITVAAIITSPSVLNSPRKSGSSRAYGITANGLGSVMRPSVPRLVSGNCFARLAASTFSRACASRAVTPAASRPTTRSPRSPRSPGVGGGGTSGVHRSTRRPSSSPSKRGGSTPTTV